MTELRTNLRLWLATAKGGDEVVITERGLPVARLVPIESSSTLARLTEDGTIAPARSARRPRAASVRRPKVGTSLSDTVSQQRR
ncbi:MAG: type II toxin-antitoxin system prevent-host-death family antitoxin [Actinobacteria bacterium]|nr:type II toxin-antitoxin system prevent-host-death family antitoxin [Actinomycetota bacterium]